jgi:hypothetical protein
MRCVAQLSRGEHGSSGEKAAEDAAGDNLREYIQFLTKRRSGIPRVHDLYAFNPTLEMTP